MKYKKDNIIYHRVYENSKSIFLYADKKIKRVPKSNIQEYNTIGLEYDSIKINEYISISIFDTFEYFKEIMYAHATVLSKLPKNKDIDVFVNIEHTISKMKECWKLTLETAFISNNLDLCYIENAIISEGTKDIGYNIIRSLQRKISRTLEFLEIHDYMDEMNFSEIRHPYIIIYSEKQDKYFVAIYIPDLTFNKEIYDDDEDVSDIMGAFD